MGKGRDWLSAYANGVINVECPHCGAQPLRRCKGGVTSMARDQPPHSARRKLAKEKESQDAGSS